MAVRGLFLNPLLQILNRSASPGAGARMRFTATGTDTLKAIYADGTYTTQLDNPLIADNEGRFAQVYLDGVYRVRFEDGEGNHLGTIDGVSALPTDADVSSLASTAAASAVAASIADAFSDGEPIGGTISFSYEGEGYRLVNSFSNIVYPASLPSAFGLEHIVAGNPLAVWQANRAGEWQLFVQDAADLARQKILNAHTRKLTLQIRATSSSAGNAGIPSCHDALEIYNPHAVAGDPAALPGIAFSVHTSNGLNKRKAGLYAKEGGLVCTVQDQNLGAAHAGAWETLCLTGTGRAALASNVAGQCDLGTSLKYFRDCFLQNAPTTVSDVTAKKNLRAIPETVLDAWGEVQGKIGQWADESDDFLHAWYIAQEVVLAFSEHGENAFEYGLVYLHNGRLQLRYSECAVIEAAWARRELARLHRRVEALEKRHV